MSILELLTAVLITCSTPESGCRVIDIEEKKNTTMIMCIDNPGNRKIDPISIGIIDLDNPEKHRYLTIQPVGCIDV